MENTSFQNYANPWDGKVQKKSLVIGDYRVVSIPTGVFGLDGGAMFGTVPKVLWQRTNPTDDQNRIAMEARALLLIDEKNSRNIMIDCGIGGDFIEKYGEKLGSKFASMYSVDENSGFLRHLKAHGLTANDITDVILTHLHFDHAGGATCFREGKLQPSFPNATYYVQSENLKTASNPNLRERASYYAANFEALLASGVLKVLNSDEEILPGISLIISNGHTQGQQLVKITGKTLPSQSGNNAAFDSSSSGIGTRPESPETTLIYCGDLIPTSTHIRLAWIMGYDLHPLLLMEEKKRLLEEASTKGWYLYFEHDPYMDCAQVKVDGADFAVSERFQLI
jgi:glyoxylase-like metal-dependent hydrolase (beta-lactamase superfamily II)